MLRGRVISTTDGKPLQGVSVKAYAPALGSELWSAGGDILQSVTNESGQFAINLPASGVLFWIIAESSGTVSTSLISGETDNIELKLQRYARASLSGRVLDREQKPVPNLDIRLVGEYNHSFTTRTAADGAFQFSPIPDYIGQALMIGSRDGLVMPQRIIRGNEKSPIELILIPGGTMGGTMVDRLTKIPVAGVNILVRPGFSSAVQYHAISDPDGKWLVRDLPAGDYYIEVHGPDHIEASPAGRGGRGGGRSPLAGRIQFNGGEYSVQTELDRLATIKGILAQPDGTPLANAIIAVAANKRPVGSQDMKWVRTGLDGSFQIKTDRFNTSMPLVAYHEIWGRQVVTLEPVAEGEIREVVGLRLPGSTRIKGTVVDEAGKGVPRISLQLPAGFSNGGFIQTDEDGRFDLGRLSLIDPAQNFTLYFTSPRPGSGGIRKADSDPIWRTLPQNIEGQTFVIDTEQALQPEHDKPVDLKVIMKRTELLLIRGKITDLDNKPPVLGQVFLFNGTTGEDWSSQALPDMRSGGGFKIVPNGSHKLSGVECEPDGSFAIYVLRNDGEAIVDGTRFSLGVATAGKPRKLVTGVVLPTGQSEVTQQIVLDQPAPATLPSRRSL